MTAEIGATQQGLVSTQMQQVQTDVPTAAERPEPPPAPPVEPVEVPEEPTPPPAESGRGTNVDTTA